MKPWIMGARPRTLTAAVAPVLAGTALGAVESGKFTVWVALLALLAAIAIQIGTNLVNDAADFQKGTDTEERLGPPRVTQMGLLTPRQVWIGAAVSFAIAALCGLPLVLHGGIPILAIGIFSVLCGYAYTSGPFPLAYHGLGEVFVILFFGVVAVSGSYFLQAGAFSNSAVLLGVEIGLLASALIAVNNYRDLEGDKKAGKRTLAARFGHEFARREVALCLLLPFALHLMGDFRNGRWMLLLAPLAVLIIVRLWKSERGRALNPILGRVANFELLYAICVTVTLLWP